MRAPRLGLFSIGRYHNFKRAIRKEDLEPFWHTHSIEIQAVRKVNCGYQAYLATLMLLQQLRRHRQQRPVNRTCFASIMTSVVSVALVEPMCMFVPTST